MLEVAVHATVRDEPHQVEAPAALLQRREGLLDGGVARELTALDGVGDARHVLLDDAPGADRHVPTSELPIWPGGRPTASPEVSTRAVG